MVSVNKCKWGALSAEWLTWLANSRRASCFNERVQGGSAYLTFSSRNIHIHVDPQQEHSEHLLSKEWLVKIDNEKSVPYLMVRPSFYDKIMACSTSLDVPQ